MVLSVFDESHKNEHKVKIFSTISIEFVHNEKSESELECWNDVAESDIIIFCFCAYKINNMNTLNLSHIN